MSRVTGLFHAGVTVSDMSQAMGFYRDLLGLTVRFDEVLDHDYLREVLGLPLAQLRAVYLDVPGGGLVELLEYHGLERLSGAARPCDPGSGHLCLYVDDVDEVHQRAVAAGYRARSRSAVAVTAGPNAGARSVYLLDPDGYPVELFQPPPWRDAQR